MGYVSDDWPSAPLHNRIYNCDAFELLESMPDNSVNCIVTSPPYFGLRDYGSDGQIGLEETPAAYVAKLVSLFREARRVLRDDGTLWLNLGDSYAREPKGSIDNGTSGLSQGKKDQHIKTPPGLGASIDYGVPMKSLLGIPWRVAFGLQDDGWILRSDIIWNKPNPMPESVTDRPTKAHEYVFLLTKSPRYWYDADAIKEPAVNGDPNPPRGSVGVIGQENLGRRKPDRRAGMGRFEYDGKYNGNTNGEQRAFVVIKEYRNKRSVWTIPTEPNKSAHFATFPTKLIEPMILAGCPAGGLVLDPFMGSGTTALVARRHGRNYIGSELNPEYVAIARERLRLPFEERHVVVESKVDDLPLFAQAVGL